MSTRYTGSEIVGKIVASTVGEEALQVYYIQRDCRSSNVCIKVGREVNNKMKMTVRV